MANYVLIKGGVVDNIFVADDGEWVDAYASEQEALAVPVDGIDPQPGIGWLFNDTTEQFTPPVPPPTLIANPMSIPPDGTTASTVTYTNLGDAPAQVTFVINSNLTQTVDVVAGVASIPVAARVPNDTVKVTCAGLSVVIGVTA